MGENWGVLKGFFEPLKIIQSSTKINGSFLDY